MYTMTDLGTLNVPGFYPWAYPQSLNNSGQVVGYIIQSDPYHAFRTAPNIPINPETDDIGMLLDSSWNVWANAINDSGQVAGSVYKSDGTTAFAFRTAPNSPINLATDNLGSVLGSGWNTSAVSINNSGQVVGSASKSDGTTSFGFRTAPNNPINPSTDDLGLCSPTALNDSGQVVGLFNIGSNTVYHAFRTAPNSPFTPATDDLGSVLGSGWYTSATNINNSGQVIGYAYKSDGSGAFAFRTAPNSRINPATDDIGGLLGSYYSGDYFSGWATSAFDINSSGEVVGYSIVDCSQNQSCQGPGPEYRAFIYSGGTMNDLNDLVPPLDRDHWYRYLMFATAINDVGQIVGYHGDFRPGIGDTYTGYLLTPIYKAFIQQPINADGSSVFAAKRGVIPVKFAVTQYGTQSSCTLPATIAITRTAGGTLGSIDESIYSMSADNGSNFRIDSCRYVYNLAASALGVGTYRVDISMNGIMVGHTAFALK